MIESDLLTDANLQCAVTIQSKAAAPADPAITFVKLVPKGDENQDQATPLLGTPATWLHSRAHPLPRPCLLFGYLGHLFTNKAITIGPRCPNTIGCLIEFPQHIWVPETELKSSTIK